jgi:hypothetical protein
VGAAVGRVDGGGVAAGVDVGWCDAYVGGWGVAGC